MSGCDGSKSSIVAWFVSRKVRENAPTSCLTHQFVALFHHSRGLWQHQKSGCATHSHPAPCGHVLPAGLSPNNGDYESPHQQAGDSCSKFWPKMLSRQCHLWIFFAPVDPEWGSGDDDWRTNPGLRAIGRLGNDCFYRPKLYLKRPKSAAICIYGAVHAGIVGGFDALHLSADQQDGGAI